MFKKNRGFEKRRCLSSWKHENRGIISQIIHGKKGEFFGAAAEQRNGFFTEGGFVHSFPSFSALSLQIQLCFCCPKLRLLLDHGSKEKQHGGAATTRHLPEAPPFPHRNLLSERAARKGQSSSGHHPRAPGRGAGGDLAGERFEEGDGEEVRDHKGGTRGDPSRGSQEESTEGESSAAGREGSGDQVFEGDIGHKPEGDGVHCEEAAGAGEVAHCSK